ncbi:hypothetical protein D3C85_1794490 [compost metagenome]
MPDDLILVSVGLAATSAAKVGAAVARAAAVAVAIRLSTGRTEIDLDMGNTPGWMDASGVAMLGIEQQVFHHGLP